MLPEVRPRVSTALADQLEHQLDLAPHLEAGQLDVEGVAGIAVVVGHRVPAARQHQGSGAAFRGRRGNRPGRQVVKTQVIGELWFRDIELTTWRVLHADRRSDDPAGRKAFLDVWTSV